MIFTLMTNTQVLLPSSKLVTEHITFQSGNSTRDKLAFQTAFAEQWLLGMTDFQVAAMHTLCSSFVKFAAFTVYMEPFNVNRSHHERT